MAILTNKGFNETLRRLHESSSNPDLIANEIERLKENYTEIEGYLGRYGQVENDETLLEYEFQTNDVSGLTPAEYEQRISELQGVNDRISAENEKLKNDIETSNKRYIDAFWQRRPDVRKKEDVVESESRENINTVDPRKMSFDDIIKVKE